MIDARADVKKESLDPQWIRRRLRRYLLTSFALFLWALFVSEGMAEGRYHTTRPFLVLSAASTVLALAGLIWRPRSRGLLIAAIVTHLTLWIPCLYPMTEWPGGDDASGMAWFWFLGAGCLIAIPLAVRNLVLLIKGKK
ncbi:MAG TPA: hypothetical protein P5068_17780 [Sedimentisphaerales bacterium]|nr:hypothetical protein [Sedimentisphaerales bacterium]HRV49621.1 hypothetical protein [Sedimentisphaerales bacterium]